MRTTLEISRTMTLLDRLRDLGAIEVFSERDIPICEYLTYVVLNGPHIIHIGKGRPVRLQALLPDSRGLIRHQKTLIAALSHGLHGGYFRYFAIPFYRESSALRTERSLHYQFGETKIVGIDLWRRTDIARALVEQLFLHTGLDRNSKLGVMLLIAAEDNGEMLAAIYSDYLLRGRFSNLTGKYFNYKWINRRQRMSPRTVVLLDSYSPEPIVLQIGRAY